MHGHARAAWQRLRGSSDGHPAAGGPGQPATTCRSPPATWEAIRREAAEPRRDGAAAPRPAAISSRCCRIRRGWARCSAILHEIGTAGTFHPRLRPRPRPAAIQPVPQVHGRRALPAGGRSCHGPGRRPGPAGPRLPQHLPTSTCCTWPCCSTIWARATSRIIARWACGSPSRRPSGWACRRTKPKPSSSWSTSICMMNHLAFRRDTSDEQLLVRFAVEVGSPELLQMLYVLTAADWRRWGRTCGTAGRRRSSPTSTTAPCSSWPAKVPPPRSTDLLDAAPRGDCAGSGAAAEDDLVRAAAGRPAGGVSRRHGRPQQVAADLRHVARPGSPAA